MLIVQFEKEALGIDLQAIKKLDFKNRSSKILYWTPVLAHCIEPLYSPIVHWLCLSYFSLPEGRLTISRHLSWFPNRIILWVPACNTLLLLYIFTNSLRVSTFQLEPNKKQSNKIWSIEEFSNFCKVILVRNEVLLKFWINRLIAGEPQIRSYFCL